MLHLHQLSLLVQFIRFIIARAHIKLDYRNRIIQ